MPRTSPALVAFLAAAATTRACTIPEEPLSNTILDQFSIVVQNPAIPVVHNHVMNFMANGDDEHLVLRPAGVVTGDTLYLEDGLLHTRNIHAVIDLEYNDQDDTTKMFMTERPYHPNAVFQPVYGCDPDTDELQIRLQLVSRQLDPPVLGGQIGIRKAVETYEFRYTPPNNPLLNDEFLPVNMVIFRDGNSPTATATLSTSTTPPTTLTTITTLIPTNTAPPSPVGDYDYVSCWAEPSEGRALPAASFADPDMTLEMCAAFCSAYPYFGTQWSTECFCDVQLTAGSAAAPESECNMPCGGDASQLCGGSRRLSLFHNDAIVGPEQPATIGNYELYGCVTDSQALRTLSADTQSSPTMTLETCAAFCDGYEFFGVEWSVECWCGDSLAAGATVVDASECSMTCGGDSGQLCGNGDRLSVYQLAAI